MSRDSGQASTSAPLAVTSPEWEQPCSVKALSAAVSAGVLGWVFGFLPSILRNRSFGLWKTWLQDAGTSGKSFAIVSGSYTFIQCICQRIRQKDDGINRGFAGCATGLAMGWSGGPASAAQSCVGLGLLSYFVDFGGAASEPPAHAASLSSPKLLSQPQYRARWQKRQVPSPKALLKLPPVMWLGAVCNNSGFFNASPLPALHP
mmetsp:Transcript_35501/g.78761  ORF Transcript_35501/g.78761 Transcript_35501/m.78761 type:complete len:204 (+) Transcript_35501:57-668(+)